LLALSASAQEEDHMLATWTHQQQFPSLKLAFLDTMPLAEFTFIPAMDISPYGVAKFLLQHPFITLGVAAALYYIIPRAFQALVRFLVVPAVLAVTAYIVLQNPQAALGIVEGIYNCKS
jgi:hypothetical protein